MKCTLFIPYVYADPVNDFEHSGDELSDKKYIQILTKEYNEYKNDINNAVYSSYLPQYQAFGRGLVSNNHRRIHHIYKQISYQYAQCECTLKQMNGEEETIDNLIRYFQTSEQFILIIQLMGANFDSDAETEFKMWIQESEHINTSNRLTEKEKLINLPKKDFKIAFSEAKSTAVLKECKLLEAYGKKRYAILIKEIIFVKE